MKKLFLFLLLWFSVTFAAFSQWAPVTVQTTDNRDISLMALKGEKLTIVDFWATWCKPCLAGMKLLNEIYSEYKDKGVQIVGVNVDGPRNKAKVQPLVRALQISYPIVLDAEQALMSEWNLTVTPSLVMLNANGNILWIHEGYKPGDEDLIRKEINKWLDM